MSLERIRQGVLDEAKAEAERLIAEAREKRDREIAAAKKRLADEKQKRIGDEKARLEQVRSQAVSNARRIERLAVLKAKNRFVDKAFAAAREKVAALPDGEYLQLLEKWIVALDAANAGEIETGRRDAKRIDQAFVERVNAKRGPGRADAPHALRDKARPAGYKEHKMLSPMPAGKFTRGSSELDIDGGVVIRTPDYRIDLSLRAVLDALREELTPVIGARMFPEEN